MTIALRGPRLGRWIILGLGTAVLVPSACFLDSTGLSGAGSSTSAGSTTSSTSSSSTTSSTSSTSSSSSTSASSTSGGGSDAGTGGGTGGGGDAGPDGGDAGDGGDGNLCGDGVVDPGEDCDGANLGTSTCATLGHTGGPLTCDASCKFQQGACFDYPANWYDVAWHHRRSVTLQHGQVPADLTSFPVVLTFGDPGILGKLQASGADVLITAGDGKTKLNHEIERFNVATGELVVWVRVPTLSSTADTVLYLYYGNATSLSQENATAVWDASDQTVLHLGEPATASMTTAVHHDSTGHGFYGSQQGNSNVSGKIGQGQLFDGVSNYIDVANPAGVVIGNADCTISAWIKTSGGSPTALGIVTKAMGEMNVAGGKVLGLSTAKFGFQNGSNGSYSQTGPLVNDGNWHHVAWTQTAVGTSWDFYVDGVHDHVSPVVLNADPAGLTLRLGSRATGSNYATSFFSGILDEVRISSTPRSSAWIVTSFHNQNNPTTFGVLGSEEGMLP